MDEYVDPVLRMQERCTAPRRSLIGNWVHSLPDDAYPGPNLDWLHEMVRFFDHWLKGIDNGVMDEPGLVLLPSRVRRSGAVSRGLAGRVAGAADMATRRTPGSGSSISRRARCPWSAASTTRPARRRPSNVSGTDRRPAPERRCRGARAAPRTASPATFAPTNRSSRRSRAAPLEAPLDVVGFPAAILAWESSAPVATAVVRLSDVAPDGTSSQVTAGILNLTHRDSHASPVAARTGRGHERPDPDALDRLPIPAGSSDPAVGGVVVLAGHLAVAVQRGVRTPPRGRPRGDADSRLILPTIGDGSLPVPPFKTTPAGQRTIGSSTDEPPTWRVIDDVIAGTVTVTSSEFGEVVLPDGTTSLYTGERLEMTASDAEPASARLHNEVVYRVRDHGSEILIEASGTMRSTESDFHMNVGLRVTLDGAPFFERGWLETIPRRLV